MKVESSNAIQILLLVGGITLVPALLFTVTGFSPLVPRDAFALRIALTIGRLDPGAPPPTPAP